MPFELFIFGIACICGLAILFNKIFWAKKIHGPITFKRTILYVLRACLAACLSVVTLVITGITALYFLYFYYWEIKVLPESVKTEKIFASRADLACSFAFYELSSDMADKLNKEGIASLAEDTQPRSHLHRNRLFSSWQETPLPPESHLDDLFQGVYSCVKDSDGSRPFFSIITKLVSEPGNFYIKMGEYGCMTILFPKKKLAAYMCQND